MIISKQNTTKVCRLSIGDTPIKQVQKYLGSIITEDGKCDKDVRVCIGMAKEAFEKLSNIMKNNKISMATKIRMLNCYVYPILTYSSECWTMSHSLRNA
jgi:uncharacterized protein (UPF0147 family)